MLPYGGQQLDVFVPPTSLGTVHGCVCTVWVKHRRQVYVQISRKSKLWFGSLLSTNVPMRAQKHNKEEDIPRVGMLPTRKICLSLNNSSVLSIVRTGCCNELISLSMFCVTYTQLDYLFCVNSTMPLGDASAKSPNFSSAVLHRIKYSSDMRQTHCWASEGNIFIVNAAVD